MDSRRSMGTSKPWTQPKRSSTVGTGSAATASGTGAPSASGMSKLPKPKQVGTSSSKKARSSSIDTQSARRTTSVTRSDHRTPLRASRHLMPSSGANSGGSMRGYGGRESMTPNHRETVKVAVKDNRPLTEKSYQQEKTRDIIEFCRSTNYPGTLALNNFPLSSSEFRKLFEFLMQFLVPDFVMPKMQEMGIELPALLKKLGYPGTVSKATFQTIGTQHSWASTLGMLSYLLVRAKAFLVTFDNVEQTVFQNLDDHLEEASDKLFFEHFVDCYAAFHHGRDDYSEEIGCLEEKFMEVYEINENIAEDLERKLVRYKGEYDEIRASTCNTEKLLQDLKDKKEDLNKMKDYSKVSMDHLRKKQEECANQTKMLSDLERKKNILKNSVAELDKFCREEKGVNPDEASGLEYIVHELERQVAQKKKALEEASAVLWKTEQALSKRHISIDSLCSQFNLTLMELKIENAKAFVLGREKSLEDVRSKLTNLADEYRHRERSLKESSAKYESDLSSIKVQLNRKVAEVKKSEDELRKRQDEHDQTLRKAEDECAELTKALESAREKVMLHSDRAKRDLKGLEIEMERAQMELRAVQEEREKNAREGTELIQQINSLALEERDRRVRERTNVVEMYEKKVKEVIDSLLAAKKDVKNFVEKLPKC